MVVALVAAVPLVTDQEVAASATDPVVREVHTVTATDLGLVHPTDLAYDPAVDLFFVVGAVDDDPSIVAYGPRWKATDPAGALPPARLDDGTERPPGPLSAVNPADGLVYRYDNETRQLLGFAPGGATVAQYDASSVGLVNPASMVFAPSTDITDDPTSFNLYVADAGDTTFDGGITEVTLEQAAAPAAPTESATLVQSVDTSGWAPPSTDPSGIVWNSAAAEFVVVDSEVNETPLFADVNLWRIDDDGSVRSTGATDGPLSAGSYSNEPTGVGLDESSSTMFITDDTGTNSVYVVSAGAGGILGDTNDLVTQIDVEAVATDPEDPTFHVLEGVLYFLSGIDREIFRIDPVDGVFGNGDDLLTSFDISHLGPTDFEGLTSAPARGTLYVAARADDVIFEITTTGTIVRQIEVDIADLTFISGLALAPASTDPSTPHLWLVDRAADEVNDGMLFEIAVSNLDDPNGNTPPTALADAAATVEDTGVTIDVLANDTDPDGDALTPTAVSDPPDGTTTTNPDGTITYTPDPNTNGTDTFTYRATDGVSTSSPATVTVTVTPVDDPPTALDDTAITTEDTPVTIDVLANDADPDGDALTPTAVSLPPDGTTTTNPDGTITYIPDPGFSGTDTFTYRADDGTETSPPATVTITVDEPGPLDQLAVAEQTVFGSSNGDLTDTFVSDDAAEELVEEHTGGPRRRRVSRLDHRWTLQVAPGDAVTFVLEARRPATGEGDDFEFSYSANGGATFTPLTVVSSTSDVTQRISMPPTTSGTVIVRAVDIDRTAGNGATDSLFVDRLAIQTDNPQAALPTVTITATDAIADETGDPGLFTVSRDLTEGELVVGYTTSGTATEGSDYQPLSGSVTLPDGQASATISLVPIDDTVTEGNESVVLGLAPDPTYRIGFPSEADVELLDDDFAGADLDALAQQTVRGVVASGDLASTYVDDGQYLEVREEGFGGGRRTRLEHRWTFDVGAGAGAAGTTTFFLQAHRTATEGFGFAFSTDGSSWTEMLQVTATADDATYQQYMLPAGVTGTIEVRVVDLDSSKLEPVLDSVFVDDMFIRLTP